MADDNAPRLYLVTPTDRAPDGLAGPVEAALATGLVACLRLDLGSGDEDDWMRAANLLLPLCHAAEVPLVVTDRPELVAPLGLDGVHLARSTASVTRLRKSLGAERILGAWGGASRHRAMTLAEAGADYVAVGPAGEADELVAWWAEMIETPIVVEGGVDLDAARRLGAVADFVVPEVSVWDDPGGRLAGFAVALAEG
ncbi:MAG: thiamine phosphate synthase [Paracoccaceae bacterium]